ncbi:RNA-directed DNA polymerase [Gregarina niphandrodes]|uniref:RNA-directed DNA polymerase n=1 Tax=Gregarina niphandrodes TaxID=110365 RepID=A0A023AWT8_GRENI|nr:RNA-directed DNA polymerase [Gregarina niphandrodes]EZG43047.1 RNA-directed DNA polymerase [Gregarina niphandrodes]|eukprot:XP_011133680.1 RNA-directed DNA polymerase [Gregarina niphandrodes]
MQLRTPPNFTLPTRVVKDRVTHDCRPLLPYVNDAGRFPNIQSCWPIITWGAQQARLAKIDLSKAFHTIPLPPDQVGTYAFRHRDKYYAYKCMPMGATNAPKHFHHTMGTILKRLRFAEHVRYYQDDIFIAAETSQQLKLRYEQTKQLLTTHGFKINNEKSQLQCTSILGYELFDHTLTIPKAKWAKIQRLMQTGAHASITKAAQTLQYYKHALTTAQQRIVTKLLQQKVKDNDILKIYCNCFKQRPSIRYTAQPNKPLRLYIDTSNVAVGLSLIQGANTLMTKTIDKPATHNYSNTNEA